MRLIWGKKNSEMQLSWSRGWVGFGERRLWRETCPR